MQIGGAPWEPSPPASRPEPTQTLQVVCGCASALGQHDGDAGLWVQSGATRWRQSREHVSTVAVMLLRLRLLISSAVGASMLLLVLCLGGQNLYDRPSLQLGFGRTAPLPSGFLVGVALALGVLSGGSAVALLQGGAGDRED